MRTIIEVGAPLGPGLAAEASLGLDFRIVSCPECGQALERARRREGQAYLVDLEGQRCDPFALIDQLGRLAGPAPLIACTLSADPRRIVRAVRSGALEVLAKPLKATELRETLAACLGDPERSLGALVGVSPAMERIRRELQSFAAYDYPLLITGESGTGKELAARAIHELSRRSSGPYMARNCAALPRDLVESELFGSSRGAFTGASDRPGAFELADGGSLFLDEIGDASLHSQAKLLRALESGTVWRLGARNPVEVDVRLVSATSKDLGEAMARGRFRADLFYRIETLRLHIPPLRERREDILVLARHFLRGAGLGRKDLGSSAAALLLEQSWPGNVRQLRNAVLRAVVASGGRDLIEAEDLGL